METVNAYQHTRNKGCIYRRVGKTNKFEWLGQIRSESNILQEIQMNEKFKPYKEEIMSTTFGVKIPGVDEPIEVAFRSAIGGGKSHTSWINPLAVLLPNETPVEALDNTNGGIYTIGDIKEVVQEQNKE